MSNKLYLLLMVWLAVFQSCVTKTIVVTSDPEKKVVEKTLFHLDTLTHLKTGFTGLIVSDLKTGEILYSHHADKYFTPASNTKIFSLYAALVTLGDSIPALKYVETDTTFIFWPTANPSLLHPYFNDTTAIDFLKSKSKSKSLIYADGRSNLPLYAPGWMWDDYDAYFQAELTPFPLYGNVIHLKKDSTGIKIAPKKLLFNAKRTKEAIKITRDLDRNNFEMPDNFDDWEIFEQEIPYKNASEINVQLLEDLLEDTLIIQKIPIPKSKTATFYGVKTDTILRRMMLVSDNMLADHLLLASGMILTDSLSLSNTIQLFKNLWSPALPHRLLWVDGSGLSRYNRFTPATILALLQKMHKEIPEDRLFSLFPTGGKFGTLSEQYNETTEPYIFAKTGSMTGVFNLSGYLIAKSGRKLAFSCMNNLFTSKVPDASKDVEKIIKAIRDMY